MLLADGEPVPPWLIWIVVTAPIAIVALVVSILRSIEKVRHRASINDLERRHKEDLDNIERRNKEELEALERRRISDLQDQARRTSDDDREQKRRMQGDDLDRARTLFQHAQVKELVNLLQDQLRSSREEIQQLKDEIQKLLSKP